MLWKARDSSPLPAGGSAGAAGLCPSPGLSELLEAAGRMAPARVLDLGRAHESTLRLLADLRLEVQVAALEPAAAGNPLPDF